ncbi:uncharacterized protein LOC114354158 [Ostrinia furnacalis]|uniref:uncharacterized protein LOC114354158 n=1 Tax=Ostrinia furnacalis TaxID=93504 RepID=UPI001039F3A2|nr:uncharacterized protein LOC114354158 [Ostrinia furnacalis]
MPSSCDVYRFHQVCERHGRRLLCQLVGDSLLEPFWPTGSGCARGFLSALDAAWAVRAWGQNPLPHPLEVIAERESIYRLLGGVHREGESSLDISADLNELGRSKTLVVCSGVKSILDIGRTLEYLETQGVCVCTFGNNTEFPAFYTVRSGFRAPYNVENARRAAKVLGAAKSLRLQSGIIIAVPVPEEYAMDESIIDKAINTALEDAKKKGIQGKEVTPFILSAVANATGGDSLKSNIALVKNNAKVGADIAVEFKKLGNADNLTASNIGFPGMSSPNAARRLHTSCATSNKIDSGYDLPRIANPDGDVLVIGGANVDRTYRVAEDKVQVSKNK